MDVRIHSTAATVLPPEPAIAFPDQVPPDFERGEVLASQLRDETDQRDHQPVAVADGVGHAHGGAWCWFALVHQVQSEIDELDAGDDGTGAAARWRCCVEARLDGLEPAPIPVWQHDASRLVKVVDTRRDGPRRIGFGKVSDVGPDALYGESLGGIGSNAEGSLIAK
jgi:hypothetical protein